MVLVLQGFCSRDHCYNRWKPFRDFVDDRYNISQILNHAPSPTAAASFNILEQTTTLEQFEGLQELQFAKVQPPSY